MASGAGGCPNGAPGASLTFDVRKTTFYYIIVSGNAGASLDVRLAPQSPEGSWTNPTTITTLTTSVRYDSPEFTVSGWGMQAGGKGARQLCVYGTVRMAGSPS